MQQRAAKILLVAIVLCVQLQCTLQTVAEDEQQQDAVKGGAGDETTTRSTWVNNVISLCDWAQNTGVTGMVVYSVFLGFAVVIALPCTPLEMIPGFLFGFKYGALVALAGKNLGNLASVILAKTVMQKYVLENIIPKYHVLKVMNLVAKKKGLLAVLLFRGFVYAPMMVKNYGLGAMGIPVYQLTIASIVTGTPYGVWWAYLGSSAKSVVDILDGKDVVSPIQIPENKFAAAAMLGACAILWYFLIKYAREAWAEAEIALKKEENKKGE